MKLQLLVMTALSMTLLVGCGSKKNAPTATSNKGTETQPSSADSRFVAGQKPPATDMAEYKSQPATTPSAAPKPVPNSAPITPALPGLSELPDVPEVEGDQFAQGEVWVGKRMEVNTSMREWRLTVTKRAGDRFQGEIYFIQDMKTLDYSVEGTAPCKNNGDVRFATPKADRHQMSFEGKVSSGELGLVYNGNVSQVLDVVGAGTMKQKSVLDAIPPTKPRLPGGPRMPSAQQQEQERLRNSEYFAAAKALTKANAKALVTKRAAWAKESEKLTADELVDSIKAIPCNTPEERLRWNIYNARLQTVREASLTPEQRQARQSFALLLLAAAFSGGGGGQNSVNDRDKWVAEYNDNYIRNRAFAESESKGR